MKNLARWKMEFATEGGAVAWQDGKGKIHVLIEETYTHHKDGVVHRHCSYVLGNPKSDDDKSDKPLKHSDTWTQIWNDPATVELPEMPEGSIVFAEYRKHFGLGS